MKDRRKTCTSSSGKSISLSSTFDPLEFNLPGMKQTPNYSKQFTQKEKRKKAKNKFESRRRGGKRRRYELLQGQQRMRWRAEEEKRRRGEVDDGNRTVEERRRPWQSGTSLAGEAWEEDETL